MPGAVRRADWFVLLDPTWQSEGSPSDPPAEVIVGGWRLDKDGSLGPFQSNPRYIPANNSIPTDPIDALLRLITNGENCAEQIIQTLKDTVVQIGCDDQGQLCVGTAPDDVPCVLVVTAEIHKQHSKLPRWRSILGAQLPKVVPAGLDILFNAGGNHQFRIVTDAIQ
ncbi:type VII secretion system-associated protein [Nocardia sp. NPDC049190]|uniref:type VII secretion system-associated protein n=1 Tax=Nocardia sp. NPDC049190 TaxID=3155650 RepID=UPI0033E76AC2